MMGFMKSETKLFAAIILGTIVLVVGGIFLLSRSATPTTVDTTLLERSDSHKLASSSAKVTLVEFSDYQCPACGAFYPYVKQLTTDYKDKLAFVYRNFPLTAIHQNAELAAQAAEAAGLQGKYWEMHDMLFTKQQDWGESDKAAEMFSEYAKTLGLDEQQFTKDLNSDTVKNIVAADVADGNSLGINQTPTFYLDGTKLTNFSSYQDFMNQVKEELQKVDG